MPSSVRERVVREMTRVTKPGGSIVVVDYGLPRSRFASALAFHIVKLYERHHYASFVKSDWQALLEHAGVDVLGELPALRGMARVMTGRKAGSAARAFSGAAQ
jgi:SAM-dependent methyltransferase